MKREINLDVPVKLGLAATFFVFFTLMLNQVAMTFGIYGLNQMMYGWILEVGKWVLALW